jgi:diguanylate cyclase (GGDEF)-like protein
MRNPDDTRNIGPRIGSPPWFYLTAVSVLGAALLAATVPAMARSLPALADSAMFWVVGAMVLAGEVWRIVTPGRSGPESPAVSRTICVAALLFWGFPIAVLLRAVATAVVGIAQRNAAHRIAFNVAQLSISLGAAGLVLNKVGVDPGPGHPWVPTTGRELGLFALAAVAYFVVNFGIVVGAVSLRTRTPALRIIKANIVYQVSVHAVLLATVPLVMIAMRTHQPLIVALFLFPLAAIYFSAAISVQRDYQANHDELTGLLNRKLLATRSSEALARAGMEGARAGFLLIDLDRSTGLKQVNDTLGHAVGDRLLKTVAHRLTQSVRPGDVVARLGGDEFAVLLPSVREATAAREVASRLRAALAEPVRLEAMTFQVEASVGIAIYPDDADTFEQLLQRADVAMYVAKERHSGIERYQAEADRNSAERLALASDLRSAVLQDEIELYYQPKVRLADLKTIGMEALARWPHPQRGVLAAAEFIGIAEQSHLISELTEHVVDKSLGQTARWWDEGLPVQVCVNLPARDLLSTHLVDLIRQALVRYGLPPDALRLDINEQVLAGKSAHASATVQGLAELGVGVSLDDFGTGYSSLAQLTRLGISEVKLDPDLVSGLPGSVERSLTVKSLVRLAQSLGIRSIGEGVETEATAAALRLLGCDGAQGWYFSRPLNAIMATKWLVEQRARGATAIDSSTSVGLGDVAMRPALRHMRQDAAHAGPYGAPAEIGTLDSGLVVGTATGG